MGSKSSSKQSTSNVTNNWSLGADNGSLVANHSRVSVLDAGAIQTALSFASDVAEIHGEAIEQTLDHTGTVVDDALDFADTQAWRAYGATTTALEYADANTRRAFDFSDDQSKRYVDFADTQAERAYDVLVESLTSQRDTQKDALQFMERAGNSALSFAGGAAQPDKALMEKYMLYAAGAVVLFGVFAFWRARS